MIVRVNVVLNRTVDVDSDRRFDNLCGSHLQSQSSLCGRRLKGKGKGVLGEGVLGARETRGAREEALIPFHFPFKRLPRRLESK